MHKTARPGGSGGAAKAANRQDKAASRPTSKAPTKSTKSPTTTSKRSISSVGTKKPAPSSSTSRSSSSRAKISQHRQGVKSTYQSSKSKFSTSSSPSSRSSPSTPSQSRLHTRNTFTQQGQQQQKKGGLLNAPLLSQQKASISTTNKNVSSLSSFQQKSIQSTFASIPMVATATGLQSTHLATPTTLHMNQLRDISTLSTPLRNSLMMNKNNTVRSLVTNTPTFTPDIQSLTMNSLDLVPVFTPLPITSQQRTFATKTVTAGAKGKGGIAAKGKKKDQVEEAEGGEEVFAQAGDVKKNIRNWLEQILTSKPEVYPMPQAAQENEELFVKECQVRFAQRLDKRTRYEQAKIILKQRAIGQLPGELKKHALSEDPALWSMRVITPYSDPPRKKWLMEHFNIPYKASQEEIDTEEFLKKKYARL